MSDVGLRDVSAIRVSRRELLHAGAGFLTLGLPASRLLAWQDAAAPSPKFSSNVSVVTVLVAARDKNGKIVADMVKEDFTIDEDGKLQTVKYFAKQTDLPLTLGLLIDTSFSQRRVLSEERGASYEFLQHVMREEKDKAFVIHFDREVELLQDLTSSRQDLNKALEAVESRPTLNRRGQGGNGSPGDDSPDGGGSQQGRYPRGGGGVGGGQGGQGGFRAGTTMYDAILLASDELMKKQQGRKALMLLSDGVDRGSKTSLNSAIESAQRADTLIYSIHFADTQSSGGGAGGFGSPRIGMGGGGIGMGRGGMGGGRRRMPQQEHVDGKKILEQISRETGGDYFEASSKMPLGKIYDRIEEDLRNQYSLGYNFDADGAAYRKIKVSASRKNVLLTAREGYYAR